MIDETASKIPIWLIWATTDNGLTTLVGVTLTNSRALSYRKIILADPHVVTVVIEPSEANHLFNPNWDYAWQRAYGDTHFMKLKESVKKVEQQRYTQLEYERNQVLEALGRAAKRIEELEGEKNDLLR